MVLVRRWVLAGVFVAAVGGGAAVTMRSSSSSPKVVPLSSEEFNNLHDQKLLMSLLKQQKTLVRQRNADATAGGVQMIFYRLLGCPFCARVKAILDLLNVPYQEVLIDPLTGGGIEDSRYPFAPQIKLVTQSGGTAPVSTMIVDSGEIIKALSAVYGFEKDLKDPRIAETRKWIADRFQGVTFAAINSSWWYAFHSYPDLVPSKYSNILCRVVGATALYVLATYKIQPKLKEGATPDMVQAMAEGAPKWLLRESAVFTSRLDSKSKYGFHGGDKPDLADVEMYAVVRNIANHPDLKATVRSCDDALGVWLEKMQPYGDGRSSWK